MSSFLHIINGGKGNEINCVTNVAKGSCEPLQMFWNGIMGLDDM
jgi:hypothetical protein